jgi:50S ribosomal protein L16 3-hydroxylase
MLYDAHHVFINGEAVRIGGRDLAFLEELANARRVDARTVRSASRRVHSLLSEWIGAGWLRRAR